MINIWIMLTVFTLQAWMSPPAAYSWSREQVLRSLFPHALYVSPVNRLWTGRGHIEECGRSWEKPLENERKAYRSLPCYNKVILRSATGDAQVP